MTTPEVCITHCSIEIDGELPYYDKDGCRTMPLALEAIKDPRRTRCSNAETLTRQTEKNAALAVKAKEIKDRLDVEVARCSKMGAFCHHVQEDPRQADKESVLQLIKDTTYNTLVGRLQRAQQAKDKAQAAFDATKNRFAAIINRKAGPQLRKAHAQLKSALRLATIHNKAVASGYCIIERAKEKHEEKKKVKVSRSKEVFVPVKTSRKLSSKSPKKNRKE